MARISTRLAKLEESTGSGELSLDSLRLLVSLLGRFDALWWPFRTHNGSYRAEVQRMQLEFLAGNGSLRAAAQGETNWKAGHYARNALLAAGLTVATKSGGQVTGLRLTPQGISDAMVMVGDRLHRLNNQTTLTLLIILQRFEGCNHSGKWMMENKLFGEEVCKGDDPNKWHHAIDYLLPLLRYGYIKSTSDLWNRCYFIATDLKPQDEPSSTRTLEPWADQVYIESFNAERTALQRLTCLDGGVFIPMRCS